MKLYSKFFLLPLSLLTGCASIMNGTKQSIAISSTPTNAEIWLDHRFVGNTPMILNMDRKDNHFVKIQLEGYQPYELTFSREISGWVAGNIVFGGVIGLAVDVVTGGIYKLSPDQIQMEMDKGNVTYSKNSSNSHIAIVLQADSSWEEIDHLKIARS